MASTQSCILGALSVFRLGMLILSRVLNIIYLNSPCCGWYFMNVLQQKMKYQMALCDITFTFQVLDRQRWLQHDIAVYESFEGCCTKRRPGLDKWDTNSSRNTTSSRYTYGPCSSFWSLVCLKKLMRICIKKPCTNKLQNITARTVMSMFQTPPTTWSCWHHCLMMYCFPLLFITAWYWLISFEYVLVFPVKCTMKFALIMKWTFQEPQ